MMNLAFVTDGMDKGGMPPLNASKLLRTIRGLNSALKSHLMTIDTGTALAGDNKITEVASVKNNVDPAPKQLNVVAPTKSMKFLDRVTVSIRIMFMKINMIDTIHDRYSAEVLIQNRWREPQLDGCKSPSDEVEWDKLWNPRLTIENAIGEPKDVAHMSFSLDKNGLATVCESRRVNGMFFEFMELQKFPFDSQDLTVTLVSERNISELHLIEYGDEKSGVSPGDFSAAQEWVLHPIVNVWTKVNTKKANKAVTKYPAFSVAAKASRRPQFFIWNIILVMFLICSLAFASFTCEVKSPHFRLQLTFILLLTTVTFKFAVNKNIPRISYLTFMDKYILGSMFILFSCCVWHCCVYFIHKAYLVTTTTTTTPAITSDFTTTSAKTSKASTTGNSSNVSTKSMFTSVFTGTTVPATTIIATTVNPISATTVTIDNIALGLFLTVYITFHLVFIVLISCEMSSDHTSTNIEVEQINSPVNSRASTESILQSRISAEESKAGVRNAPMSGTGPTGRRASARARSSNGNARELMLLSSTKSSSTQ